MGQYFQRNEQTPSVSTLIKVGFVFFFFKKNNVLPTAYRSNAENYVKLSNLKSRAIFNGGLLFFPLVSF